MLKKNSEVSHKGRSNEGRKKEYSVGRCAFCKPLKESNKGYINPPTCPYTKVEIGGKVYKRDRGDMYDFPGLAEPSPHQSEPCSDCGVVYGNVHHVGCAWEKCPVDDEGQFLGCGHDEDAKYIKGPNDFKYHPGLLKQLQVKHRSVGKKLTTPR